MRSKARCGERAQGSGGVGSAPSMARPVSAPGKEPRELRTARVFIQVRTPRLRSIFRIPAAA
ncbi:hypothetical protein M413DRAFT_375105 [Hebeloma cylindrosporum]|uniref:Uncharacterized protein n=1 Tax=Hebeloma cylindrosporum TaxID=76867 RepID=A0A0C3C5K4_HEBCY|nr:hypothetical protein M413DRAFT_375105 [Hebeloma cylindrosporum h7]